MGWIELTLRFVFVCVMFLFQLLREPGVFPVLEFCLILTYCSVYLLTKSFPYKKWLYTGLFFITAYFLPNFYVFAPVVFYEWTLQSYYSYSAITMPFLGGLLLGQSLYVNLFITGLSVIGIIIHSIIEKSHSFERTSYEEIDALRFLNERIKNEQERLLHIQDERVHASMLAERKRIVAEIHDTLGHQLSSSIIQIGALQYVIQEPVAKDSLLKVQDVLSTSMDNVRAIIHTERQTAVNLEHELQHLIDGFTKCPLFYQFQVPASLDNQMSHSILNIVKEGLTNINKHSDATSAQVSLIQTKDRLVLLIADNGKVADLKSASSKGIGLLNMEERVSRMGGKMHASTENGFRIFITIPMREANDENLNYR